jgi:hypothetical protein
MRAHYIDKTGRVIIRLAEASEGGNFSEGLAPVRIRSGLAACGYIDKAGKIALEPQFISCGEFTEGLASVRFNDSAMRAHYIDKTGRTVINTPFGLAYAFHGALAPVYDGGIGLFDRGYIDRSGKIVWKPVFRELPFHVF